MRPRESSRSDSVLLGCWCKGCGRSDIVWCHFLQLEENFYTCVWSLSDDGEILLAVGGVKGIIRIIR